MLLLWYKLVYGLCVVQFDPTSRARRTAAFLFHLQVGLAKKLAASVAGRPEDAFKVA